MNNQKHFKKKLCSLFYQRKEIEIQKPFVSISTEYDIFQRIWFTEGIVFQRGWTATDPNTPPETLERLANDDYRSVRLYVARNPNTPQYLKDYLKFKDYYEQR